MHHEHVAVHVCTISILWNFHTNPYHPSKNYELKQQCDGAGEHLKNDKLRVAGHGPGNARPSHKHCKACAKHVLHKYNVLIHVDTVFIEQPIYTINTN